MATVSVIIPVYGVERYIAQTIDSVLAQTYQDFELLIVDDESPDQSVAICQQFTDPRIQIIHQKNRGLAGARNAGIRQAQGAFVAFLDGDDLWLPDKLEKHLDHLARSPKVGVSFSRSAFIDQQGKSLGTYLMPQLTGITPLTLLKGSPVGNGSAPVLRREVLDAIRFQDDLHGEMEDCYFDEHFRRAEDAECWLRILTTTDWEIEGIPEALTLYRVNPEGLSASLLKQFASTEQVLAKAKSYAPELIDRWGNLAKAYNLRYLARSAVRYRDGQMAVELWQRSLKNYWQIILEEPLRTLRVGAGAYLVKLLPKSWYERAEEVAAQVMSTLQKRRISQDSIQLER